MKLISSSYLLIFTIILSLAIITLKLLKSKPKITFASLSHDSIELGEVGKDYESKVQFYVINKGKHLLYVFDIVPDCYCTILSWNKQPVFPSDSTLVTVVHKTNNIGYFEQNIRVHVNAATSPLLVTVKGRVKPY